MLTWPLPDVKIDLDAFVEPPNPGYWEIPWARDADETLRTCKSRLDKPYAEDRRRFEKLTIQLEPSRHIRDRVMREYAPQLATNAWFKLIELIATFGLPACSELTHFDNASAPGAFIMAMNYWTSTIESRPYKWTASSLIAKENNTALGDSYGLARLYPHNFATHGTKFDGNTFDVSYLRWISRSKFAGAFNLYTSDLGMFVPEAHYNCQEAYNARGNLGQILMGLLTLRRGGMLITKQFANMSSFTLSLMAAVASVFDHTWISKPITSKPDNSETYIVAQGYRGAPEWLTCLFFDALMAPWDDYDLLAREFAPPLFPLAAIGRDFIDTIVAATNTLVARQCAKIDENLAEYLRMVTSAESAPSPSFVARVIQPAIAAWFKAVNLRPMKKEHWIRVSIVEPRR
jgi:hypothetical protein